MNITSATAYESFCKTFVYPAVGQEDVSSRAKLEEGAESVTFSKNANDKVARWLNRCFSKPNATNSELKALSAKFYQAVSSVFLNRGIPPKVLEALGVHNSSEGVMRPLSARCIRRVAAAIERYNPGQPNKTNRQLSFFANPRTSDVPRPTSTVRQSYEYAQPRIQAVASLDKNLVALKFQPLSAARSKGIVGALRSSVNLFLFSSGHVNSFGDLSLLEDVFDGFESNFGDGANKTVSPARFLDFLDQLKDVIQSSFGVNGQAAEKLMDELGGRIMQMICEANSDTDAKPTEEEKTDKPSVEAKPTATEKTDKSNAEVPLANVQNPVVNAPRLQKGVVHQQTGGTNTCFTWSLVNGMAASDKLRNHFESLIDREKGTIKVYTSGGRKEISLADKQGVPEKEDAFICSHTQNPFERFVIRYCYMNDSNYQQEFKDGMQYGRLPMGNEAFMARTFGLVETRHQVRIIPDDQMPTSDVDGKTKAEDAKKLIRKQVNAGGLVVVNKNSVHFVSITGISEDGQTIEVADSTDSQKPRSKDSSMVQNNVSPNQNVDIRSMVTLSFFDLPTAEGIDGAKEYVRNSVTADSVKKSLEDTQRTAESQVSQSETALGGNKFTVEEAREKHKTETDPVRKKHFETIRDSLQDATRCATTSQLLVSEPRAFENMRDEFIVHLSDTTTGREESAHFVQLGGSDTEEGKHYLNECFKAFLFTKASELQK